VSGNDPAQCRCGEMTLRNAPQKVKDVDVGTFNIHRGCLGLVTVEVGTFKILLWMSTNVRVVYIRDIIYCGKTKNADVYSRSQFRVWPSV
jgi:hypothetical protein